MINVVVQTQAVVTINVVVQTQAGSGDDKRCGTDAGSGDDKCCGTDAGSGDDKCCGTDAGSGECWQYISISVVVQHNCHYHNNDKFSRAPRQLCEIRRRRSTAECRAEPVSESVDVVTQNHAND